MSDARTECGAGRRRRPDRWAAAVAIGVAAVVVAAAAGCGSREEPAEAGGPPRVAVSIFPLASLVQDVLPPEAEVTLLLPPGRSPHGFEPQADRVAELARADVLVVNGLGLDAWAEDAASAVAPGIEVLRLAVLVGRSGGAGHHGHEHGDDDHDAHGHARDDHGYAEDHGDGDGPDAAESDDPAPADGHGHDHSGPNPHLWLDPILADHFVRRLADDLAARYPDHAGAIRLRAAELRDELASLDAGYREAAAEMPTRELVTFHNAFDVLAARYGLEVVAHLTPVELSPGGEVPPGRLGDAIEAIRSRGLGVVYAEPQFPDRAVEALRQETGVRVLRLDPLGDPTVAGYRDYSAMMRSNLAVLIEGQGGVVP